MFKRSILCPISVRLNSVHVLHHTTVDSWQGTHGRVSCARRVSRREPLVIPQRRRARRVNAHAMLANKDIQIAQISGRLSRGAHP